MESWHKVNIFTRAHVGLVLMVLASVSRGFPLGIHQLEMCTIDHSVVDVDLQRRFNIARSNMPAPHLQAVFAASNTVGEDVGAAYSTLCPVNQERRSCTSDRCGMRMANILPGRWMCNCDADCAKFGDCCHNVHTTCAHLFSGDTSSISKREVSPETDVGSYTCQPEPAWNYDINANRGYFMVSQCPSGWETGTSGSGDASNGVGSAGSQYHSDMREYIAALCAADTGMYAFTPVEEVLLKLPIYHKPTGALYKNYYCGLCHGITTIAPSDDVDVWTVVVDCPLSVQEPDFTSTSDEELLCYVTGESSCRLVMVPSNESDASAGYDLRKCQANAISDCAQPDITPAWLVEACSSYTSHVFTQGLLFKNVHCAVCNGMLPENHLPYYRELSAPAPGSGVYYIPEEMPGASWQRDITVSVQTINNLHNINCGP